MHIKTNGFYENIENDRKDWFESSNCLENSRNE